MKEKAGLFGRLKGKKTDEAVAAAALVRPDEETLRKLTAQECCCPYCGRLLAAEDVFCPGCEKEQPWFLKEV